MRAMVQVDLLHVLTSDEDRVFQPPVMLPLSNSQVEQCNCPDNTTGLSCQVSCFIYLPY